MDNQKSDLKDLENRNFILDISGLNSSGHGVGKIEGLTIFVEGAIPGEKVEVKVTELKKNYCIGRIEKIISSSPNRTEPFCDAYGSCGGCSLQHISYDYQLTYKTGKVKDEVERISGVKGIKINDIIGMDNPLNYRNKAEYFLDYSSDAGLAAGFYARESHNVVDHKNCHICSAESNEIRDFFKELAAGNNNFDFTSLTVRKAFSTGEVMVIISAYDDKGVNNTGKITGEISRTGQSGACAAKDLASSLAGRFSSIKSVYLNKKGKHFSGYDLLYGQKTIRENISNYSFDISPGSFFQVNTKMAEVLFDTAIKYAGLSGREEVLDLYCGAGTLTILMAGHCKIIIGVEVIKSATDDAKANARLNGVKNAGFVQGETVKILKDFAGKNQCMEGAFDVAVVDPPRTGLEPGAIESIAGLKIKKIVYISCNPSTLARDIKRFAENGYTTIEIQPVDMFPHTEHVEAIILMTRNSQDG